MKKLSLSLIYPCVFIAMWLLFIWLIPVDAFAGMRFISAKDGLSNTSIHSIFQDKRNYIWIATDYGLNRLSGKEIKVFTKSFSAEESLPNNYTFAAFEDSRNNFWFGTLNGLYRYDYRTESFTTCFTGEYSFLSEAKVSCILEDTKGFIWMPVSGHGLLRMNVNDHTITLFDSAEIREMDITAMVIVNDNELWLASKYSGLKVFNTETYSLVNVNELYAGNKLLEENSIFSLCEDGNGNLLVASLGAGLFRVNIDTRKLETIGSDKLPVAKLVHTVLRDRKGRIWVGTDGGGLWLFDEQKEEFTPYYIQNFHFNPLIGKVQYIYEDKQGNIWVSFVEKGVLVIPAQDHGFNIIENNPYSQLEITDQSIVSVLIDRNEKLWLGTSGSGLYRLAMSENGINYVVEEHVLSDDNVITALFEDSRGLIYIGTYLKGFYVYNPHTKRIRNFNREIENTVNCNHITAFAEDQQGIIWISTNGGGINRYDTSTDEFIYFRQGGSGMDNYLISDWCNSLYLDNDQMLWVATYAGMSRMDLKSGKIESFTKSGPLINSNAIVVISGDDQGNIWIGTNWGLNRINKRTNEVSLFTTSEGLPDNAIAGIQYDRSGDLWVSTNSGISRYDKEQNLFVAYTMFEGLNNLEFKPRSTTIDKQGNLYFGGINGVSWFNPEQISMDEPILGVALSGFSLFNEPVSIGKAYDNNVILDKALEEMDKITLNYDQNNFSINFDALEYTFPERIRYEYMLKGLDQNWQNVQLGNHIAVYTNVPPGNYTFIVKAFTSSDNQETAEMGIRITPPWWLTSWAKGIYVVIAILLLYVLYKVLLLREKEKQRMLEREHNEQLAQAKLQLFTDISHDIRTPLTLVISPLLKLIEEEPTSKHSAVYQIMHRNASRILRLVNQLLDVRKIDRKQMHLRVRETDIVSFVNDIVDSFSPLSTDKDIALSYSSENIPDTVWIDVDFIDKIIYNLLSNAFKFTRSGGRIDVGLCISETDQLVFKVSDTGCGIAAGHTDTIFNRFYQVEQDNSSKGTGIGLHLAKMLAELHHGRIEVSSVLGEGSVFSVTVPYKKEHYKREEMSDIPLEYNQMPVNTTPLLLDLIEPDADLQDDANGSKRKPLILLIEDNADIRNLLKDELQQRFRILEAADGKKGYELATIHIPDLIITDVMMPGMDGVEMTKRLRGNNNTRHIPIIMLTARVAVNDSIEGIEAGADVYISKPFDLRFLMVNIINLINRQTLMKTKHTGSYTVEVSDFKVKSADDKLLEKLNAYIKQNLGDSSMSIESISQELGISRVHLHRKLKELCQLTPSVYLRNIRLEHAAHLLATKKISVAEVAYAVGFSSHQYFSNCFKDFYGQSPAEYAEEHRNKNISK